jgi:predicted site-specific integrase-resolvase
VSTVVGEHRDRFDVTEILISLCARLYGRRAGATRVRRAVDAATLDGPG